MVFCVCDVAENCDRGLVLLAWAWDLDSGGIILAFPLPVDFGAAGEAATTAALLFPFLLDGGGTGAAAGVWGAGVRLRRAERRRL